MGAAWKWSQLGGIAVTFAEEVLFHTHTHARKCYWVVVCSHEVHIVLQQVQSSSEDYFWLQLGDTLEHLTYLPKQNTLEKNIYER